MTSRIGQLLDYISMGAIAGITGDDEEVAFEEFNVRQRIVVGSFCRTTTVTELHNLCKILDQRQDDEWETNDIALFRSLILYYLSERNIYLQNAVLPYKERLRKGKNLSYSNI